MRKYTFGLLLWLTPALFLRTGLDDSELVQRIAALFDHQDYHKSINAVRASYNLTETEWKEFQVGDRKLVLVLTKYPRLSNLKTSIDGWIECSDGRWERFLRTHVAGPPIRVGFDRVNSIIHVYDDSMNQSRSVVTFDLTNLPE